MLIDWFTVVAQIVNFLVLMALLKYFLYDRVIQAMAEREQRITDRLEEADQKRRDAEERQRKVAEQEKEIDEKRTEMLEEAKTAARSKRQELEQNAREKVDAMQARWLSALEDQKASLARHVQKTAARQVIAVARRVVVDMGGEDFQERVVDTFSDRIRQMGDEAKQALKEGLNDDAPTAEVRSGSKLSTADRQKITRLLREEVHPDLEVEYGEDGSLVEGLEVRIDGRKISWNLHRYLEELEDNMLQALEEAPRRQDMSGAEPAEGRDQSDND